jgi:hypothetical protein
MLELSDPLWSMLDDADRDKHIPTLLAELAVSWNAETANSLRGALFDQYMCFGATYAAIPHLLRIAEPEENRRQRLEIAAFLGSVSLDGRDLVDDVLPETLEGWDRKLDFHRSLGVTTLERPDAGDMDKILAIRADFFSALPAIRALCERALFENWEDDCCLLSGIAAADGLLDVARLLQEGDRGEGGFRCSSCDWPYEFIRFGERIAVYAEAMTRDEPTPNRSGLDWKEGMPSRADGFMAPITENDAVDARIEALLALASQAPSPEPAMLTRHFAGTFLCCKCGVRGPMRRVW